MIQLDFVCWIFETAILIISEKVSKGTKPRARIQVPVCLPKHDTKFCCRITKIGKETGSLILWYMFAKKKVLTSTLQTGLLCFGNSASAELATFNSRVVEPASYKEKRVKR